MKAKILSFVLIASFILALSLAFASAASSFSVSGPATLTQSQNTTTFTVTANENSTFSISSSSVSMGNATASISPTSFSLNASQSKTVTLTMTSFPSNLGTYTGSFVISNATATDNQTVSVSYVKGFCSLGQAKNGTIRYLEILSVKDSSSEDDWKWKPADEVEVQVKVKYENSADSDDSIDGIIEVGIYDSEENVFVEVENEDDLERDISLDEGDSLTENFVIQVPVEDMEDSNTRYKLYVKVYEDGEEDSLCTDSWASKYYQDLDIRRNSYEVALKNIEIDSNTAICGSEVTITATAWNIGTNDEDKVYIQAVNSPLKINENTSTFALDEGDSKKISISFLVPKTATDGNYDLLLTAFYKYSDSSDSFRDATEDPYKVSFKIEGCNASQAQPKSVTISADYSAETPKAVIGSQFVIESVINNTGKSAATFSVEVSGTSGWSEVAVDPKSSFTLEAGKSQPVDLYFDVKSNVEENSNQTFKIRVLSDGVLIKESSVQVTLEKGMTASRVLNHLKENWYIYAIVLVNLILIIAIIAIVSKMVSKD